MFDAEKGTRKVSIARPSASKQTVTTSSPSWRYGDNEYHGSEAGFREVVYDVEKLLERLFLRHCRNRHRGAQKGCM